MFLVSFIGEYSSIDIGMLVRTNTTENLAIFSIPVLIKIG